MSSIHFLWTVPEGFNLLFNIIKYTVVVIIQLLHFIWKDLIVTIFSLKLVVTTPFLI